ncbi:MAG: hypothetical protein R3F37_17290 [Candidatus Competibacteraceae bacterium]
MLGRVLDSTYAHDVTALFSVISAQACQRLGLVGSRVHLDATSFHVDGDYAAAERVGVVTLTQGTAGIGVPIWIK